jgi:hypothetical protein
MIARRLRPTATGSCSQSSSSMERGTVRQLVVGGGGHTPRILNKANNRNLAMLNAFSPST